MSSVQQLKLSFSSDSRENRRHGDNDIAMISSRLLNSQCGSEVAVYLRGRNCISLATAQLETADAFFMVSEKRHSFTNEASYI